MRSHRRSIVTEQLQQWRDGNVVNRSCAGRRPERSAHLPPPPRRLALERGEMRVGRRRRQQFLLDERVRDQVTAEAGDHRRAAGQRAASRGVVAPALRRAATLLWRRCSAASSLSAIWPARAVSVSARRSNKDRWTSRARRESICRSNCGSAHRQSRGARVQARARSGSISARRANALPSRAGSRRRSRRRQHGGTDGPRTTDIHHVRARLFSDQRAAVIHIGHRV